MLWMNEWMAFSATSVDSKCSSSLRCWTWARHNVIIISQCNNNKSISKLIVVIRAYSGWVELGLFPDIRWWWWWWCLMFRCCTVCRPTWRRMVAIDPFIGLQTSLRHRIMIVAVQTHPSRFHHRRPLQVDCRVQTTVRCSLMRSNQ